MRTSRILAVMAAMIILVPAMADARVGGGGSRGSKTNQAPPPTQTAPAAKPVERSVTPSQQAQARPNAAPGATQGGFFARNPFMSGLMGGLLGAGLIGMLFGGGFGGFGGMAGMLGLLLQLALIGGLGYLAYRLIKGRSAAPAAPRPAFAGGMPAPGPGPAGSPMGRSLLAGLGGGGAGAGTGAGAAAATASSNLAIAPEDFNTFERMLSDIQSAFSKGDLAALRTMVTPEMLGYFSEQLSVNASRGVENKVEAVKLEQGDLAEAWSEGGIDYASVAMRFSMIDVTRRIADGTIVEGNAQVRTEATEVWTFLRSRGGNWILTAISEG
ncbi:MAG: Tim44 domain-containing protein [Enhydrobacter sp.]|nr:Tim44 domain-containing protein [Enhydrobacter sp.]